MRWLIFIVAFSASSAFAESDDSMGHLMNQPMAVWDSGMDQLGEFLEQQKTLIVPHTPDGHLEILDEFDEGYPHTVWSVVRVGYRSDENRIGISYMLVSESPFPLELAKVAVRTVVDGAKAFLSVRSDGGAVVLPGRFRRRVAEFFEIHAADNPSLTGELVEAFDQMTTIHVTFLHPDRRSIILEAQSPLLGTDIHWLEIPEKQS